MKQIPNFEDDDDFMMAWVSLVHSATRLRTGLDEVFDIELGISLAEQDLIKQIAVNDEPLRLTELARRLYFSKAGITKMLDRLEAQDILHREPVPGDRRALRAVLTRKGHNIFAKSRILLHTYLEENFRTHLTDGQIVGLNKSLRALLEGHGVWDGQVAHLKGEPSDDT